MFVFMFTYINKYIYIYTHTYIYIIYIYTYGLFSPSLSEDSATPLERWTSGVNGTGEVGGPCTRAGGIGQPLQDIVSLLTPKL